MLFAYNKGVQKCRHGIYMISWIFNISIISLLVILILHYVFEFFGHSPTESSAVNKLQIQKYKSIIEKMTREADTIKTAFEEDHGIVNSENNNTEDLEQDLELYIRELVVSA